MKSSETLIAETDAEKIERSYRRWQDAIFGTNVLQQSGMSYHRKRDSVRLSVSGEKSLEIQYPGTNANKRTAIGEAGEFGLLLSQSYSSGFAGGVRPPIEGLEKVRLQIEGPKNRNWHIIADLNSDLETIALQTVRVALTRAGRHTMAVSQGTREPRPPPAAVAEASAEQRGVIVRSAHDIQVFDKEHANVWSDLKNEADKRGATCIKPRNSRFETDAVISSGRRQLLIEIKTSATASDIYCAIGQLTVYPRVIPSLAGNIPVLLIPKIPSADLSRVLSEIGITVSVYSPGAPTQFSADLWSLL